MFKWLEMNVLQLLQNPLENKSSSVEWACAKHIYATKLPNVNSSNLLQAKTDKFSTETQRFKVVLLSGPLTQRPDHDMATAISPAPAQSAAQKTGRITILHKNSELSATAKAEGKSRTLTQNKNFIPNYSYWYTDILISSMNTWADYRKQNPISLLI